MILAEALRPTWGSASPSWCIWIYDASPMEVPDRDNRQWWFSSSREEWVLT